MTNVRHLHRDPVTLPCPRCKLPLVASDRKDCPRCVFQRRHPGMAMWGRLDG